PCRGIGAEQFKYGTIISKQTVSHLSGPLAKFISSGAKTQICSKHEWRATFDKGSHSQGTCDDCASQMAIVLIILKRCLLMCIHEWGAIKGSLACENVRPFA